MEGLLKKIQQNAFKDANFVSPNRRPWSPADKHASSPAKGLRAGDVEPGRAIWAPSRASPAFEGMHCAQAVTREASSSFVEPGLDRSGTGGAGSRADVLFQAGSGGSGLPTPRRHEEAVLGSEDEEGPTKMLTRGRSDGKETISMFSGVVVDDNYSDASRSSPVEGSFPPGEHFPGGTERTSSIRTSITRTEGVLQQHQHHGAAAADHSLFQTGFCLRMRSAIRAVSERVDAHPVATLVVSWLVVFALGFLCAYLVLQPRIKAFFQE